METRQQLLDSLTSHLAIFHTSKPNTNTNPRAAILRWFSALSVAARRAALTIVDRDLISVILNMLSQLHRHGHGFFFLLPDVPSDSDPLVPSILFRRSSGLLARVSEGNLKELELGESVLLFCTDDTKGIDALTVSEDFVSDINRFVEVMDKISAGKFLIGDEDINITTNKSSKWPELPWLQDIGYYSLEAYLVNRLEITIRVSWIEATGGGRKGKIVKSLKDKAGVSANVFWRKKGCLDWWARLNDSERENLICSFLSKTTRSMANEIADRYKTSSNNKKIYFFNHQSTLSWQKTKQSFFRKKRSSISLDDITLLPYRRKKPLPGVITRLITLFEVSLLKRKLCQLDTDALFFTTLSTAGTVCDYVLSKLREVLMSVSVECVKLELLEDTSGPCRPSPAGVNNKGKKKGGKSKRHKSGSKSKAQDSKVEGADNNNCSTSSSSQSTIPNKEPNGSSEALPVKESPLKKENKENGDASVENNTSTSTKTKNKRKGKNKSKTLESNKNKNPISTNNTIISTNSPKNTTNNISPALNSSNNFSNNNLSKPETSKSCNNSSNSNNLCKPNNSIPKTSNKNETEQQVNQTTLTQNPQNLIPETNSELLKNRYFEFQNPQLNPLSIPQLNPPQISYDWPPLCHNKLTQYMVPTQEFNHFLSDTETYSYSEEESDSSRYPYSKYNQIFGGGVMYWSPSEYVGGQNGPFSSRPPSMSSEDSAWARHEANIVQIVDEMTVLPTPPGGEHSLDGKQEDPLPYSMLRPIIVPNRISRRGSRSEINKFHMSPCISSSARRAPPRVKRPPSPVVLCVPRVPRPPPPSPVDEGSRRRGGSGFTVARSGSSSPRNWEVRGACGEGGNGGFEKGGRVGMDGPEVVWTSWVHKGGSMDPDRDQLQECQPRLLREQLIEISQWDQHPDIALPLQPPDSVNSAARLLMHNLLHEEIDYFCKQVRAGNIVRKPYVNWAINRVTKCLQVLWPRSRTNLFGSNATGLALPTSDVDLVVSLPPVRNLEPIKEAGILEGRNGIKETCLQHAARYLSNQEWVRSDSLKTIENTAIPIIMLVAEVPCDINFCNETPVISEIVQEYDAPAISPKNDTTISKDCTVVKSIRLDISFKSSSHTGLQTSELVRELTEQFPACVPLALVLKKFLADRSLDHSYSGGLSSHCLVLLITRFLQHEHHVDQPINQNLGRLLMDFLYFFGNVFDPRHMRVSIQGRGLYMNRERGLSIDPIHIDDPLYPANNVGRNCFRIHQCIKAFADAFTMMEHEVENISGAATSASSATSASQFKLLRKIIPSIDSYE